jgi:hypothetical protein
VRIYVGVKLLTELDKYNSDDILSLWENKKYTVRPYSFLIKYKSYINGNYFNFHPLDLERIQNYLLNKQTV